MNSDGNYYSWMSCIVLLYILAAFPLGNCGPKSPKTESDKTIEKCADGSTEPLCPTGFVHVLYSEYGCCTAPHQSRETCCDRNTYDIKGSFPTFSEKVMGYSNVSEQITIPAVGCDSTKSHNRSFFRTEIRCAELRTVLNSCSSTSKSQKQGYLSSPGYYSRVTPSPSSAEEPDDECRCTLAPRDNYSLNVTLLRIFSNLASLNISDGTSPTKLFNKDSVFSPGTSLGHGAKESLQIVTHNTVQVVLSQTPDLQFLMYFTSGANVRVKCGAAAFPVTTVTPNTGTPSSPITTDTPGKDEPMTSNNAAAIGAGVGAALVVLLALIGGVLLFFRYRRAKLEAAREEQAPPTSDYFTYDYIDDKPRNGASSHCNNGGPPHDIPYEEVEMNGGKSIVSPDDIIFDAGLEVSPNALYSQHSGQGQGQYAGQGQRDVTPYMVAGQPDSLLYETVDDDPPRAPGARDDLEYEYCSPPGEGRGAGPVPGMEVEANALYGGGGGDAAQFRTDL